jgi:hypothetical protein
MALKDKKGFLDKYNGIRQMAETTISSLKRTVAHWLRSRKNNMQRKAAHAS